MWNDEKNKLTTREKEVLAYVCNGLTNIEIGTLLNISQYTAKAYVSSIIKKLDARNRTEAVYIAVKHRKIE